MENLFIYINMDELDIVDVDPSNFEELITEVTDEVVDKPEEVVEKPKKEKKAKC